jgi:RNA polymerase sigma-70 factor, ECF subfamily
MVRTGHRDGDVDLERDRVLVERCQRGEESAFEDLYLRYRDRLYRYCVRRLNNTSEAEDAVQEAFARAWKAIPNFGGDKRFYPWLSVIANNLCVDIQRRANRCTPVEESDLDSMAPAVNEAQEALVDTIAERDLLSKALANLSDRHREVLELREGRNWSYQRIAAYSGVEVSTIETLLFRARRSLRQEFMTLARTEGALGVLIFPLLLLRRGLRRSISAVRALVTSAKGGAVAGMAVPALGSTVVAVATTAVVATAIALGTVALHPNPTTGVVASARYTIVPGAAGSPRSGTGVNSTAGPAVWGAVRTSPGNAGPGAAQARGVQGAETSRLGGIAGSAGSGILVSEQEVSAITKEASSLLHTVGATVSQPAAAVKKSLPKVTVTVPTTLPPITVPTTLPPTVPTTLPPVTVPTTLPPVTVPTSTLPI